MKKLILFGICILFFSFSVNALSIESGSEFNPSESNVTYLIDQTLRTLTALEVNETCLTINSSVFCNSSATPITIVLYSIDFVDQVTNLANYSMDEEWIAINYTNSTEHNNNTIYLLMLNGINTANITSPYNITGLSLATTYNISIFSYNITAGTNTSYTSGNSISVKTAGVILVPSDRRILVGYHNKYARIRLNSITFECTPLFQNGVIISCN